MAPPGRSASLRQPPAAANDELAEEDGWPAPADDATEEPAEEIVVDAGHVLGDVVAPPVGPGERLVRFAYRLGVPGAALHAPFRKPARPRLLAIVANPLPGDAAAGAALRAGHLVVHGVRQPLADLDFAGARLTPPFQQVLHRFAWLGDLAAAAPREDVADLAEQLTASWLDANPTLGEGPGWGVGDAAHRLLAWLIHGRLLLSGEDAGFRARLLNEIAATARWLDGHVARSDDRLAEVAGWCAVTAAGLLLPQGNPRRLYGEAGLLHALGELVGDDGGVLSRSPLAQIEAIALLVRLAACYRAIRRDPPDAVRTMLALLVPPLLGVLHGDGGLAGWQGAAAIPAPRIAALVAAAGVRARPLADGRQWGYQRVEAGPAVLMVDAAPPASARHARDGCASTLGFELSHHGQRLVVSCGGAASAGGQIPLRLAQALRATAAHSTLVIDDANSTAVLRDGRLGPGVCEVEVDRRAADGATRIEAAHDGYAARFGLSHRRILSLRDDGGALAGEDLLVPSGRRGRRANVPFAIRFHLGPRVTAAPGDERGTVALTLADGSVWRFRAGAGAGAGAGEVAIDDSLWADGQGRPVATQQLVIHGLVPRNGGSFAWSFETME